MWDGMIFSAQPSSVRMKLFLLHSLARVKQCLDSLTLKMLLERFSCFPTVLVTKNLAPNPSSGRAKLLSEPQSGSSEKEGSAGKSQGGA